ncbi:putative membrane protein [Serratia rubidaea]|nr:putative membrane protein [Serratia rubidaea]
MTFWLFGDGYQEEGKYDRLCFDDMPTKKNCIDKNLLMMVRYAKNTGLSFRLDVSYKGEW